MSLAGPDGDRLDEARREGRRLSTDLRNRRRLVQAYDDYGSLLGFSQVNAGFTVVMICMKGGTGQAGNGFDQGRTCHAVECA